MIKPASLSLTEQYPKFLLFFILIGSVLLSFTPYWLDIVTLYDNKRFFIIFYLLVTALLILFSYSIREKIITSILKLSITSKILISIALSFAVIANFTSLYWIKSQAVIAYTLMLFLTTTLLVGVVLQYVNLIFRLYVWLTLSIFISVLLYHLIATWLGYVPNYRYIFSFVNPRFINHVQIWLILPLLYWAWTNKNSSNPWLFKIPIVLHFSLLFALDARGAFIAGLCGIALWIILSDEKEEKIKWLLTLVILGLLVKWLLFTPLPQLIVQGSWPDGQGVIRVSDSNRINLWSNAIAMITFFGNGGDTFACNNDVIAHTPHNSILLIAIEWGVIPAISYIVLLLHAFYRVCKTANEETRVIGLTMLSGFAYSLISGPLNTPLSQGLAMISVALYWAALNAFSIPDKNSQLKVFSPKISKFIHIGLIFISIWALIFIGYKTYVRVENNQYRHIKPDLYKPQFWIEQNCIDAEPKIVISE